MSTTIHSPRWRGRLVHTLLHVASQNKTDLHAEGGLTLMDLINRVFPEATKEQQEIIDQLIGRINDALSAEQAAQTIFATGEEEILFDLGKSDVKACLALNGHIAGIVEETHFTQALAERERQKRKRERRHVFILVGIVAAVVLFVFIFNLPFFREMRLYSALESSPTAEEVYKYKRDFPEGKHIEEVYRIEVGMSDYPIVPLKEYMEKFPQGKYAHELGLKHDSIWDAATAAYIDSVHTKVSPEAEAYMRALLQYMKQHRVYTIFLDLKPQVQLKDLDDFPADKVKKLDDMLNFMGEKPLRANMLSLKRNFTESDSEALYNILRDCIEKFFLKYFDASLVTVTTERDQAPANSPVISMTYTVKNQMFPYDKSLPNIWIYQEMKVFKSYILGIVVNMEAQFTVPGSEAKLVLKETGEPESEFSNIKNVDDGYRQMTQSCFRKFTAVINKTLTGRPALH